MDGLTRVRVDLSWVRAGKLRAFVNEASGPVRRHQVVQAFDEDGTERLAYVDSVDGDVMELVVLPHPSGGVGPANAPPLGPLPR